MADHNSELRKGLAAIWEKSLPRVHEQLATLEALAKAATGGSLDAEEMRAGEREAHKLAGSLGTFGRHEGTRIAREIETLMGSGKVPDPSYLSRLVGELRATIESDS